MATTNATFATVTPNVTTNANTTTATVIDDTQEVLALAFCALFFLLHIPVCVATYRVSRRVDSFILFFSLTVTDTYLVFTLVVSETITLAIGGAAFAQLGQSTNLLSLVMTPLIYSSMLHNPVIALNRASSVIFPLAYDRLWTRNAVLGATLALWIVGGLLKTGEQIVWVLVTHNNSPFQFLYGALQYPTAIVALVLYAVALVWLLAKRVFKLGKLGMLGTWQRMFFGVVPGLLYFKGPLLTRCVPWLLEIQRPRDHSKGHPPHSHLDLLGDLCAQTVWLLTSALTTHSL